MDDICFEEVYDDETGQWIEQDVADGTLLEVEPVWVPESELPALLEVFPEALKRREGRALLALSAADYPEDARLEPWLRQLRGKALPLSLLAEHFPGWEKDGPQTQKVRERLGSA